LREIVVKHKHYRAPIHQERTPIVAFGQQKVLPFGIIGTVSVVGFNGQTLSNPNTSFAATEVSVVLWNSLPSPDIHASCRHLGCNNELAVAAGIPAVGGRDINVDYDGQRLQPTETSGKRPHPFQPVHAQTDDHDSGVARQWRRELHLQPLLGWTARMPE
jgi:hypothetical protein